MHQYDKNVSLNLVISTIFSVEKLFLDSKKTTYYSKINSLTTIQMRYSTRFLLRYLASVFFFDKRTTSKEKKQLLVVFLFMKKKLKNKPWNCCHLYIL